MGRSGTEKPGYQKDHVKSPRSNSGIKENDNEPASKNLKI